MRVPLVALAVAQMALLVEMVMRLVAVEELNLLAAHLYQAQVQHCKADLLERKATVVEQAAVAVDTLVVALAQIQTQALLAAVDLVTSTHLL
jgi:hypothetical protein